MTWQDAQKAFAETLPGYEDRPEQTRLAETIEKALANGTHLAAQAGTGTGKSLAALVPAINHALDTGQPVIVSTATKSLQAQYATKDLPFLAKNLGVDFDAVVMQGRSNYVCAAKVNELEPHAIPGQDQVLAEIADDEFSGLVEDLSGTLEVRDRLKITSSSDECPGFSDCPFADACFAKRAKDAAKEADVILTNHALLAMDTVIRDEQRKVNPDKQPQSILPEYSAVIVDEGHELREYAANSLSAEFSERGLNHLASEINNFLGGNAEVVQGINGAAKSLFQGLGRLLGRKKTIALTDSALLAAEPVLQAMNVAHTAIVDTDVRGDDRKKTRRQRLMRRSEATRARLRSILLSEDGGNLVRWVERDDRRDDVRLKFAPVSVAPFLREALWTHTTGVLLSATLAVGKDFSFVTGNLGMDDYDPFDAGTPFDYPNQAALYVPRNMVEPTQQNADRWRIAAQESMRKLVFAAGGRSLLLFTSTTAMKEAHAALAPSFEAAGLTVFIQGGPLNNKQIAEGFKADEKSVLFGLKSFATGFDVPGDALRLTVLDKLPFATPDDVVFAARSEAINRQFRNDWAFFQRLAVPGMALDLQQGFGRQIRTKTDEGMVAILDSRLHSKAYGRQIMGALPPARRIDNLAEAESYLEELTARRG